jgi:hypothetical protein
MRTGIFLFWMMGMASLCRLVAVTSLLTFVRVLNAIGHVTRRNIIMVLSLMEGTSLVKWPFCYNIIGVIVFSVLNASFVELLCVELGMLLRGWLWLLSEGLVKSSMSFFHRPVLFGICRYPLCTRL